MSNPGGVDNLTPFEYALAGVDVPEAEESPGLKAIGHMRSLADEVQEIPILNADLTKLVSTGGLTGRAERRDRKRRTAAKTAPATEDGSGFVDITPIELSDANAATALETNGKTASEAPADQEDVDGLIASLEAKISDHTVDRAPEPEADAGTDRPEDEAALDADSREAEAGRDQTVAIHEVAAGGPAAGVLFGPGSIKGSDDLAPPANFATQDRELSGRFSDQAQFKAEPTLFGEDDEEGTAAFVAGPPPAKHETATDDANSRPMAVAAMTGVVPVQKKRFGTAFWALTGTAAAAAVLTIGGLWWASSLNDDSTQAASAVLGSEEAPGSPQAGVATDEDTGDGTGSDNNSSTGALGDGNSSGTLDTPPTDANSDSDSDPSSSSTVTSTAGSSGDSGSQTSATPAPTTEAPTTEPPTTRPPTTETTTTQPPTTETTTTEPPTTQTTTTQPPTTQTTTTQPPTTQTTATTTPPPGPAAIGGTATIGSAGGPGLPGARVQLYQDSNQDGVFENLVNTTTTDSSGRYQFSDVDSGCYAVNVSAPSSVFGIPADQRTLKPCVSAGEQTLNLSSVARVNRPDGCLVEGNTNNDGTPGVEIYERDTVLAEAYVFYGSNNDVITTRFGAPDDNDGAGDYEWFLSNHRDVFFVAAQQFGQTSSAIRCSRG